MTKKFVDECNSCGKQVIKMYNGDSSEMIKAVPEDTMSYLLYLCDLKPEELSRPTFSLASRHWCPDCFLKEITKWVSTLKARPSSRGIERRSNEN